MNDLVWIQTSFIGDVVLTTAAFELARQKFPGVRQHVITTALGAQVLAGSSALASTIVFDKKRKSALAAFAAVRKELSHALAGRPATLLQTHRSFR